MADRAGLVEANQDDLTIWQSARTLPDLGDLMARWLQRDIAYCPGWDPDDGGDGGPEPETAAILPTLVALNRAGFVTVDSQPGHLTNAAGVAQRAAVHGFCDRPTLARIRRKVRGFEDQVKVVARRLDGRGAAESVERVREGR
jgi:hypothetical protein